LALISRFLSLEVRATSGRMLGASFIHRLRGLSSLRPAKAILAGLAPFVLRLYEQTKDPKIQTRCLSLIDSMIDLEFGSIQTELVKVER
jgi:hypothetical protein